MAKNKFYLTTLLFFMVFNIVAMRAQAENTEKPYYIPKIEQHFIKSRFVDQTYDIRVMQPIRKKGENKALPVMYVTDGNAFFKAFAAMSYYSPVIVVGICYPPGDNPAGHSRFRARDLLWEGYAKLPEEVFKESPIEGVGSPSKRYGAAEFIRFFRHELIPLIDSTYNTIPGERGYYGHSAGGGFGLHTVFSQTGLFNRLIIASPGISYDGDDFALREASAFIATGKSAKVKIFMSVGSEEENYPNDPVMAKWALLTGYHRMVRLLNEAQIPGLELITQVFPGEDHESAAMIAFRYGMKALYPIPQK